MATPSRRKGAVTLKDREFLRLSTSPLTLLEREVQCVSGAPVLSGAAG